MKRPKFVRKGTSDQILSYYQSEYADGKYTAETVRNTEGRTCDQTTLPFTEVSLISGNASSCSSLDRCSGNDKTNGNFEGAVRVPNRTVFQPNCCSLDEANFPHRRRTSTVSEGAPDKRRVAVVELDLDSIDLNAVSDGNERKRRPHILLQSCSSSSSPCLWHTSCPPSVLEGTARCRRGITGSGTFAISPSADVSPSACADPTSSASSAPVFAFDDYKFNSLNYLSEIDSLDKHRRSRSDAIADSAIVRPRYPTHNRQASRDVGIVDASLMVASSSVQATTEDSHHTMRVSPIFQMRPSTQHNSRSLSMQDNDVQSHMTFPLAEDAKNSLRSSSRAARDDAASQIAAGTSAHQCWASPTMQAAVQAPETHHGLENTSSMSKPLLHYRPGVHAVAGPSPPPPRQIIHALKDSSLPPRPPRLHASMSGNSSSADAQPNLHAHRTTQLAAPVITPASTSSTLVQSSSEDSIRGYKLSSVRSVCDVMVNGALPTTSSKVETEQKARQTMNDLIIDVTRAIDESDRLRQQKFNMVQPAEQPADILSKDANVSVTLGRLSLESEPEESRRTQQMDRHPVVESRRRDSASTFRALPISRSTSSDYSDYDGRYDKPLPDPSAQSSAAFQSEHRDWTSKIAHSSNKVIEFAAKRLSSIPLPPSRLSMSKAFEQNRISLESQSIECIYSPSPNVVGRTKSSWPDAMNCAEVFTMKSTSERIRWYSKKIADLSMYESGLSEWVITLERNLTGRRDRGKQNIPASDKLCGPLEMPSSAKKRPSSRESITSEITFPKRVDAYVATDLSKRPMEDQSIPSGPPALPYPALALAQQLPVLISQSTVSNSASPVRNAGSNSSIGKSAGGFFSSLGRRPSVSKKDRPPIPAASKLLTNRQQQVASGLPSPRPIQINAAPALKGGPRAPPGRVQRAQSVITSRIVEDADSGLADSENEAIRRKLAKRSPSVAPSMARSTTNVEAAQNSDMSDFDKKMSSLSNLLPHADRNILAGYLRRAGGQEMSAIGRYLDDEKNFKLNAS